MAATAELRQRIRALVEEVPDESLPQLEVFLSGLAPAPDPSAPPSEKELITKIQRRLPEEERERIKVLRQRLHDEIITDAEHQELLAFVDRVEQMDAERAEAMVQLSQLRNVDLDLIVKEFLPKPQHAI